MLGASGTGRGWRWRRRTRTGLLLTSIGLLVLWVPLVAAVGAIFLSLGSSFLFLGAKAAGRRHEVAVSVAFVFLTIGGVVTGIFFIGFLLEALDAANRGLELATLLVPARRLLWDTMWGTGALVAGLALQVHFLVPERQRRTVYGLCALIAVTALGATWLAEPELGFLGASPVRGGNIVEFLLRLSLYRMLEAPAYLALAVVHLRTYWDAEFPARQAAAPVADPPS